MRIRRKHLGIFEGDLTPMIDMAFQMIALFMFLLNFTEADQDERVKVPSSALAKPPDAPQESPITIQLTNEGAILFGGELLTQEGLRRYLIRESDLLRLKSKSAADATVIIRADATAQAGKVQEVIQLCQNQKFEKFKLRAREDRQ